MDDTPIGDFVKNIEKRRSKKSEEDLISAPGAKILVVDDNNLNLKVALNLFKLCKIKADAVTSGSECIDQMEKKTYDIVFLDHMMPKMDGIETLHELQKRALIKAETKMVILTANAVVGAREAYIKEGFDDYLSKPVELRSMIEMLKTYLPQEAYKETDVMEEEKNSVMEVPDTADDSVEYEFMEFEPDGDAEQSEYDINSLKAAGIDVDTALMYCAGDEEMYFELLDDFTDKYEEKHDALCTFYMAKDWKEYSIRIHALKTNLRTLGILELAEMAFALEKASKDEDAGFVEENHGKAMDEYKKIKDAVMTSKK